MPRGEPIAKPAEWGTRSAGFLSFVRARISAQEEEASWQPHPPADSHPSPSCHSSPSRSWWNAIRCPLRSRTGGNDIYVSRRTDTHDDFAWGPPEMLGPDVNTAGDENAPHYQQSAEPGGAELYFTRGPAGTQGQDLYAAPVTRDGEAAGPAMILSELNHPTANDAAPAVRTDGKEIWFHRGAPAGGLGLADLWVSTRGNANAPWSTPENPGAPLNSAAFEQQPSLSFDGRTLVWTSNRPGSVLAANGLPSLAITMPPSTVSGR